MRTLAIDFGSARIGLALSDQGGQFATAMPVLHITSEQQGIDWIIQLIRTEAVERLLVGLPLNMDGTTGPQARQTIDWAKRLSAQCGLPLIFIDERLSSFDAEQQLIDRKRRGEKITRRQKKDRLDSIAAATLLQAFLDGRLPALPI